MLYVFHGSRIFTKSRSDALKQKLLSRKPDSIALTYSSEDALVDIETLSFGQGLFESKYIVELDNFFSDKRLSEKDKDVLKLMQDSQNIFLLIEEKITSREMSLLREYSEKVLEEGTSSSGSKEFSAFSLADALILKDKKRLWVLYREAVSRGYAFEELYGILFWQLKTIILAFDATTPEEAGLKPFPFKKAKSAGKIYSADEAKKKLSLLTDVFLRSRRGGVSLESGIEEFILSL